MIDRFFEDRTGLATDTFYSPKIKYKTPKDLFSLFFLQGDCSSFVIDGYTFPLVTSDGLPLFSPSHTTAFTAETFSNIFTPVLSFYSFNDAVQLLARVFSIPTHLITSQDRDMTMKAREVIRELEIARGWKIEHIVLPTLKEEKRYRWFVADSRKAAGHFKKLKEGYCELAVIDWSWIVASFSKNCPVSSY